MSAIRWIPVLSALFATATVTAGAAAMPPKLADAFAARGVDPAALAKEIDAAWKANDLDWWFPRCVDPAGGFFEEFDDGGKPVGPDRTCVFQSRMTWVAATICKRRPDLRERFEPVALHGLAFLRDRLRDPAHGGVYWGVDANGKPLADGERHLYNIAFAIYAAAAVEEAMPGRGGGEFGLGLFRWLDAHGHDAANGGYFEHYAADGHAIVSPSDPAAAADGQTRTILPAYGFKSMNAHIHLLEALAALHGVSDDATLAARTAEVYRIVADKFYDEPGYLHLWMRPNYTPLPDVTSYGHNIETAYLLCEAAESLGRGDDAALWRKATALVDTSMSVGWDAEHGGLDDSGSLFEVRDKTKFWWVQAESLNALLLTAEHVAESGGDAAPYVARFMDQWAFIRDHLLDTPANGGGWLWGVDEEMRPLPRSKANAWKTSYHTSRALLNVVDRLSPAGEKGYGE